VSGGLFRPRPCLFRHHLTRPPRLPTGAFSPLSFSLLGFYPRVSSLSISSVVDVSVETEDSTTPPANHATATPVLGKAKRKQITAQSSRELQAPFVPPLDQGVRYFTDVNLAPDFEKSKNLRY
jgi:hypothetical protein